MKPRVCQQKWQLEHHKVSKYYSSVPVISTICGESYFCFLWTSLGQNDTLNFMNATRNLRMTKPRKTPYFKQRNLQKNIHSTEKSCKCRVLFSQKKIPLESIFAAFSLLFMRFCLVSQPKSRNKILTYQDLILVREMQQCAKKTNNQKTVSNWLNFTRTVLWNAV